MVATVKFSPSRTAPRYWLPFVGPHGRPPGWLDHGDSRLKIARAKIMATGMEGVAPSKTAGGRSLPEPGISPRPATAVAAEY